MMPRPRRNRRHRAGLRRNEAATSRTAHRYVSDANPVGYVRSLPPDELARLHEAHDRLLAVPHGPGQVGFIARESPDRTRLMWLPTADALEFLAEIDRGTEWIDRLRACPPTLAPIVTMLRGGDLLLTVAPQRAMCRGGVC